jgi:hypothetical protein
MLKTRKASVQTVSGSFSAAVPTACLFIIDCKSGLPQVLNAEFDKQEGGNPTSSITCSLSGDTCNCTLVLKPATIEETGAYQTSGNNLTLTPKDTAETETAQYCVADTALRMEIPLGMDMGSGMISISDVKGQMILARK